jgi:hypothetical protein
MAGMIELLRSIADNLDVELKDLWIIILGVLLIVGLLACAAWIDFGVWRLAHPAAPWWTFMWGS